MYLQTTGDTDFVESMYGKIIKPAADFMSTFMDHATGLPHASYDLWEERFATHTYTVGMTVAGLKLAAYTAEQLQISEDEKKWSQAAEKFQSNFDKLFNDQLGYFRKSLLLKADGKIEFNDTLDVSNGYGWFILGKSDDKLAETFKALESKMLNSSPSKGMPRYEHDAYFLNNQKYLGNPWIVATLWMAQYYIKTNQPAKATDIIDWVMSHSSRSGMLPEQIDPETGEAVGVSPLVWSHATFIDTILLLSGVTA
jgi:GH15 family glucan-1,4-alpha-glucosidase